MSSIDPDTQRTIDRDRSRREPHSTISSWHEDSRKDPEELEREIDQTRAEVQATLHALERKLSPEILLDRTLGRVREHGGEFVHNLSETVKHNPMPVLLTSIGIAWMMMMNGRRGNGSHAGMRDAGDGDSKERWSRAKDRLGGAADKLRHGAETTRDELQDTAAGARDALRQSGAAISRASHALGDRSGRAVSAARGELAHARSTFNHLLEEQPLVLGAIGLAAGAIVGAALPATEEEDRALGEARDRALERAKSTGEHGYRTIRERTERVAEQAKETLREDRAGDAAAADRPHAETASTTAAGDQRRQQDSVEPDRAPPL